MGFDVAADYQEEEDPAAREATSALEKVSAPQSGGYPHGAFGATQRRRWLQDGTPAPTAPYSAGSDHPTGRT
jgi:hypothetical protein